MSDAVDILEAMEAAHRAAELEDLARTLDVAPRPLRARDGARLPASDAVKDRWRARVGGEVAILDALRSFGPWAVSIDESPHSVLDLRGHLPEGFASSPIVRQYVGGALANALLFADDAAAGEALGNALRSVLPALPAVRLVGTSEEALEIALGFYPHALPLGFVGGRSSAHPLPFPVWRTPSEAVEDSGWARVIAVDGARALDGFEASNDLLREELASLRAVRGQLEQRECVVVVEPVQSVGERHATPRFFRALRALTSAMHTPLVFDETESGFGPSGRLAWHRRFALDAAPDHVVFGGRAGLGIVMSVGAASTVAGGPLEPAALWRAAVLAGQRHAKDARRVQAECLSRLEALAGRFPDLLIDPRAVAYSVAFELPTSAERDAFVEHALRHGALVDTTSERTVRFRMGRMFATRHIDLVFDATRVALERLEAGPHAPPIPAEPARAKPASPIKTRVRQVGAGEAEYMLGRILALEADVYEPARRDPESKLRKAFEDPAGIAVVAEALVDDEWRLVGFSLAAPLENVNVEGIPDDPRRAAGDTLYAISTTLDPTSQGHGLGLRMKQAMVSAARMMRREDGTPRYLHMSGRNRVGVTGAMQRVNARLGAYVVTVLENQYGGTGSARYYQMPIGPFRPASAKPERELDMSRGLHLPFLQAPNTLCLAAERGGLFGPAVQPCDLSVAATPSAVRAVEYIATLSPLPRLQLGSSRRDAARVVVALLSQMRPGAEISVGLLEGCDDLREAKRGDVDALPALVASIGAEKVRGIFVESVQERTGAVLDARQITLLRKLRADTGVPIVALETASAYFRSGRGTFACAELEPDLITWWGGGQVAFVHTPAGLDRVASSPDELSLVRVHHQLRGARAATPDWDAFARALEPLGARGLGGYRVVQDASGELERRFVDAGLAPRRVGDALAFIPPLDVGGNVFDTLREIADDLR